MATLRLAFNADEADTQKVSDSDDALDARVLRSEAIAMSASIGKNPYSDFILSFGVRPEAATAATIGRLLGFQVRSSDGTMQPRRSDAEKKALKVAQSLRNDKRQQMARIASLCNALQELSRLDEPSFILEMSISVDEVDEINKNLCKSISWLTRFAQEWQYLGKQQEVGRASQSSAKCGSRP